MNTAQKNSGMIYIHPAAITNFSLIAKLQDATGLIATVQGSLVILKGAAA